MKETRALRRWYERLPARHVDLIGDYAGNELFVIHGESMLLHCYENNDIDFSDGLQLLHAVYSVEALLSGLVQRKCVFHIVFFDEHVSLAIPPQAERQNYHKYILARAVIIRHLQLNLPQSHPEIHVAIYKSYHTPAFSNYLSASGVYFVMCHDGASKRTAQSLPSANQENDDATKSSPQAKEFAPDRYDSDAMTSDSEDEAEEASQDIVVEELGARRTAFRSMIYWFVRKGYHIALLNSLQWQDTKVFTMVLEGARRSRKNFEEVLNHMMAERAKQISRESMEIVQHPEASVDCSCSSISDAQTLMVQTLRIMLCSKSISKQAAQALIIHSAILRYVSLSSRRLSKKPGKSFDSNILESFSNQAVSLIQSDTWIASHLFGTMTDVADFVDGRVLGQVWSNLQNENVYKTANTDVIVRVQTMISDIISNGGPELEMPTFDSRKKGTTAPKPKNGAPGKLLPFSSPVFDRHLTSVHVAVDESASEELSNVRARVFRDLTHWHNTKPILQRAIPGVQEKQKKKALRNNQFFMKEMTQYAASLTNAVGKILEPETIIPSQDTKQAVPITSGKVAKLVADNLAASAKKNEKKYLESWKMQMKEFELISNPIKKYLRAKIFLDKLVGDKRAFLQADIEMYLLNILLQIWIATCRDGKQASSQQIPAMIYNYLNHFTRAASLTRTMHTQLEITAQSLGLPYNNKNPSMAGDKPLSFPFVLSRSVDQSLRIRGSSCEFQLQHCGPYFDRSIGSTDDDRVRFRPDAWQKDVLDVLDAGKSVFVVAPTSAGKTFISFYAMKQILKADDDGVLVYVAPTKALVNQIAAELQANFSKKFKHGGKSVWAIHTRDYRVNNTTGCQILVTLPHILQIMLMSPSNARSWAPRVKRIIFDEIHSIGQAEDGIVWEQLLLLAPCPIIALSATVGNPGSFNDWLVSTQKSLGFEMVMISHPYRYSDLRKYIFRPPSKFEFKPLVAQELFGLPNLDQINEFAYIHPVATLVNEARGLPEDLHLEPRDCLSLWKTLKKYSTADYPVSSKLDPTICLPQIIRKLDIISWEISLKVLLKQWMMDSSSPFAAVMEELSKPIEGIQEASDHPCRIPDELDSTGMSIDHFDVLSTTLPLLSELNARNALPAILFNYDRTMCEKISQALMKVLVAEETHWKETSSQWQEKLKAWEEWKLSEAKKPKKSAVKNKKKGKRGEGGDNDGDGDDQTTKADLERDDAEKVLSPFANFDPGEPQDGFHFADNKKLLKSEFDDILWKLRRRHVAEWLCSTLSRGIGVHHAGMNRSYRQAVETLFRRGFLRCVIATGTLALGINMPCRTVVFSGDSIFLTALNYRQAAGRAGRRGFDLLGNVVFQNISVGKVCRLVSSRLPDLNGHFPVTTSLVLRLFILLSESKNSRFAEKAIESLLSQPRLYLGGPSFKDQVLHHLRFSIEYLRRQHLLSRYGTPLNFAGCVSHLYFTEQSSFAFHALLKDGYFHNLCKGMTKNSEGRVLDTLMLVMSHLFGRRPCKQADQEFRRKKSRSSSLIFLPKLPSAAENILREHNKQTLDIFTAYVKTFASQHLTGNDRNLPLSGMLVGGSASQEGDDFDLVQLPATSVRSVFVALSGHGDDFESISELCRTARDGVFLEESVIPHISLYPDETNAPLNAYLYDYFRHGDVRTLAEDNGIRRGDVWFLLNDFSLVLATIVTSFRNYLNLSDLTDSDIVDAAGGGDMHEVEEDDRLAEEAEGTETSSDISRVTTQSQSKNLPMRSVVQATTTSSRKKERVVDSWDDEDIASSSSSEGEAKTLTGGQSTPATSVDPAWEEASGESLSKVLRAFEKLKLSFDEKFRAMWA